MGCSSSKSTPTVEEPPSAEDVKDNIVKNGRTMFTGVENKLNEVKDSVMDTGAKIEAALLNSPITERAGNLDNECTESNIAVDGSEMTDSMTLNTEKADDDCDGLQGDKPSTPMPEMCLVSNVAFYNNNDGSESCYSEKQSEYGDICDNTCNSEKQTECEDICDDNCTSEQQFECEDNCDDNCTSEQQFECEDNCDASCTSEQQFECEDNCDASCNSEQQFECEDNCDDNCTSENQSVCEDVCGTSTSGRRSTYGCNSDTLNSNIFNAVCTTAAVVAMEDPDTDDCSQSIIYCSDNSCNNTITSNCSQNSMKTNCQLSGRSSPESSCEFESYYNRCRNDNTYSCNGRQVGTMTMVGNVQLNKRTKSKSRKC